MKQVKLSIYNYKVTPVADFKNNFHDAVQCMKAMNDICIATYGKLPEHIFYFITYKVKPSLRLTYYVDSNTGLTIEDCDKRIEKLHSLNAAS